MPWRRKQRDEGSPARLLLWTALVATFFGLIGFGELAEDSLRASRNNFHPHSASGDIVLVKIDDRALREVGRWPWPRRYHAQLADQLTAAGARRIFFDILFETRSDPADDRLLAEAIQRSGRVTLPMRRRSGPNGMKQTTSGPIPELSRHAQVASVAASYNYQNAVWRLPYSVDAGQRRIPSLAASMADRHSQAGEFIVDYSIKPASVPSIGAEKVISGRFDASLVRGKDVVIGTNSHLVGDQFFIPGVGRMGGVYVQILGAETLKAGTVRSFGWIPAFLLALAIASFAAFRQSRLRNWTFAAASAAFLVGPIVLEANLIFFDVAPALFVVLTVWSVLSWRSVSKRGLVNAVTGLPNLNALRANRRGREQALIVARVLNYAEINASLPVNNERQLVEQIVTRLSVGAPGRVHYQGDGGIFAWFDSPSKPFGQHLEALYALFRTPIRVSGLSLDLSISFGVEIGSSRSLANRLGSAMVAAEEAAHDGLKWKYHDPETLENASWRLSMLSQLDDAIDDAQVWVAYQPKVDLKTRRIIGAEALARWTHPEKGPIAATEFVAAAEQHDRIGKLTAFVLDRAIAAAATLNRSQRNFDMSVNLSGRLLSDKALVGRIAILLERHGLEARHLTLELTETPALAGSGEALDMLSQLRDLGVNISIDDYGTGLSTLEYLKRIPAGEIKIDQSFVRGMVENRSERLMVSSTIALAHSLGRKIVAEGVETREALELLAEMECDVVQGFITGRPMSLASLVRRISAGRRSHVA